MNNWTFTVWFNVISSLTLGMGNVLGPVINHFSLFAQYYYEIITLRLAFANKKVPQEFEMFAITTLCNILTSNQRNKTKRFFRTICRLVLVNFFQNSFSDLRNFFYIIRKNKLNENQILPCKYRILTGNLWSQKQSTVLNRPHNNAYFLVTLS